jgi:glycosyltransferase involved in cell wall biosynthesis
LSSVVSQSLDDIEVICVDDCGTDKSSAILDEYAEENNRIIILKHEKNRGLPSARNTGLEAARGEFVFFLDSDDFLAADNALATLYFAACEDNAEQVVGGIVKWHEHNNTHDIDLHRSYLEKEVHGVHITDLPQLRYNVIAPNKLIKRSLLEENEIRFNESIIKHEDNPFSCQVHILANRTTILPITTYIYRQGRESSIMSQTSKADANYRCLFCSDIFAFIESGDRFHAFREIYYPMYFRQLISGAAILDRYSPAEEEKRELMDKWVQAVHFIPDDLPGVPRDLAGVIDLARSSRYEEGWKKAVELSDV